MKTKFTVRVETQWLEAAKQYAARHNTTLTRLVGEYLRALARDEHGATPILQEMTGSLHTDTPLEDYRTYLEEKYAAGESPD